MRTTACTVADCDVKECVHKLGVAWSPAYWPAGATRANATVEGVSALVIDIDHVEPDAFVHILGSLGAYQFLLHSSHSDRPDDRCLRAVFALTRPLRAVEFKRFWRAALNLLHIPGDEQTKDAARLFFLPSRPSDACHDAVDGSGYLFYSQDGAPLDVDQILATAPIIEAPPADISEFVMPEFTDAPDVASLSIAIQALGQAWPDEGRHGAQLALAGALARAGWPVELIGEFCACVAEVQQPGNRMLDKRMAAARSSVEKVNANDAVAGWPTLIEFVGEEAVQAARAALGMHSALRPADPEFLSHMTGVGKQAQAEVIASAPTPTSVDIDAALRSARTKLSRRKDADGLRDAELLKRVLHSEPLTDGLVSETERDMTLALATLAIARAVPPGTTADQIHRVMLASVATPQDLPEVIGLAMAQAPLMPSILAKVAETGGQRQGAANGNGSVPTPDMLNEFVVETQGPRQGRPNNNSQHNIRVGLLRLGIQLQYNEFSDEDEMVRGGVRTVIEDAHLKELRAEFERAFDLKPSKDELWDLVGVIARESKYHPVLDYLDGRVDNGSTDLCETWLIRYAGAPDTPYVRAVSRLVVTAAVRRVKHPGVKFDEMMILETGAQGKGKSTAIQALAVQPEWFTDDFSLQSDSKKNIEQTSGRWIIEAGELRGMSNGDANALKNYLSRQRDRARMSYDRKPRWVARQFIIIGTTNDAQYLKDATGNRRFWPIALKEFDLKAFAAVRDQLWAEAVRLERENPEESYIRLDPSLYEAAAEQQSARKIDNAYEVILEDAVGGAVGRMRVQDVWKLLGFPIETPPNQQQLTQIAVVMQSAGFEREKFMIGGSRKYWYVRGTGPERDIVLGVHAQPGAGFKVRAEALPATPSQHPNPNQHHSN